jgi:hypothetical protein
MISLRQRWLLAGRISFALAICLLLSGCPPLIWPSVKTHEFDEYYYIPPVDEPPWLSLDNDIDLYLGYRCMQEGCGWIKLIAMKTGVRPDWSLITERYRTAGIYTSNGPNVVGRPLSAFALGTKDRFLGAFRNNVIVGSLNLNGAEKDESARYNGVPLRLRYATGGGTEFGHGFSSLQQAIEIDIQLVIYDDKRIWFFAKQMPLEKSYETNIFTPAKVFHFEGGSNDLLNQPMLLYYTDGGSLVKRVVPTRDVVDSYSKKTYVSNLIALEDVVFPTVPVMLDMNTISNKRNPVAPNMICHYGTTTFYLGMMDEATNRTGEPRSKGCSPYPLKTK